MPKQQVDPADSLAMEVDRLKQWLQVAAREKASPHVTHELLIERMDSIKSFVHANPGLPTITLSLVDLSADILRHADSLIDDMAATTDDTTDAPIPPADDAEFSRDD